MLQYEGFLKSMDTVCCGDCQNCVAKISTLVAILRAPKRLPSALSTKPSTCKTQQRFPDTIFRADKSRALTAKQPDTLAQGMSL